MFTGWYTGSYKEIANKKLGNIDKGKGKGLEVHYGGISAAVRLCQAFMQSDPGRPIPIQRWIIHRNSKRCRGSVWAIIEAFDYTIPYLVTKRSILSLVEISQSSWKY
jgi:hypothetical protein